ncbi:uncharacterized protein LOC135580679 isoform X2 [Columba livia]|uniref:uncharacterized protein LOC135580679 isoform X2 n=1 Tax=Columba livia TaxID=8932 RepID=UPI0031BB986A
MRLSSAADSAVPFPSPFQPGRRPEDPLCAAAGPAESRALSARPGGFSGETPRLGRVAAGTDEDLWRGVFLRWEPGPGTRSRGVRKSRGGAVQEEKFLPVRCRENRIIPHQSCPREVLAVCHCGSRAARCAVKGCGGAGQGSPGCAETAGRLLVEQSQGQLLRCFRDGFLQDLFLVRPSLLPRPQRWSEFPSTRVCVQPGALGERVRAGRRLNGRAVSDCGTSWGCFDRVQPCLKGATCRAPSFATRSPNHRDSVAVQLLRTARLVQNSILCALCACSSFEMKLGRPVFHVTCGTCWAESPPRAPVGSVALPQPRQHRGVRWTRCWRSRHRQS